MTQPYQLSPVPLFRVQDNNNRPLSGGQVFTYIAGTTTPQASYPSPTSGSPNPNPVILNARGEAQIWLDPALTYKINVLDSGGNQIPGWPVDNVPGGFLFTQQAIGKVLFPQTAAETAAAIVPSNFAYPQLNPWRYGADGLGGANDTTALTSQQAVVAQLTGAGTNTWHDGAAIPEYLRSAAEIAAAVVPKNYQYPPGNILRYGADPSGVASSWQAFANAVAVCKGTGLPVVVPAGDFLIDTVNGSITLEWIDVQGAATANIYNDSTSSQGSVFLITGTVNTPFKVRRGVSFDGVDFFYPNQNTDGTTPTVYPPTIIDDNSDSAVNHIYIRRCKVFNAYRFVVLTSPVGLIWIQDNNIYGILTCVELTYNIDSMWITGNAFSFDVFNTAQLETNPSYRYTTRTTGSALLIHKTDGIVIADNVFFGYNNGINCATLAGTDIIQQSQIQGNAFDQTVFGIIATGTGNFNLNSVSGNLITGYDNVTAQHNLIGNGISIQTSGAGVEINTISGNVFSISTGDAVFVFGDGVPRSYSIVGNVFSYWGSFQASGQYWALNLHGNSFSAQISGNYAVAGNGAGAIQGGFAVNCAAITVSGNTFASCYQALNLTAPGAVTGNQSSNTGFTSSNVYTFPSTVIDIGNLWDKDSQKVTGFGTPTGNSVVANFPGATATLVQCSNTIAELLVVLKAKGIIGA